ncbi:hypothetical protein V8F06_009915 [Rhypophila decipiens]
MTWSLSVSNETSLMPAYLASLTTTHTTCAMIIRFFTVTNFMTSVWLHRILNVVETPAAVTTVQNLGKSLPDKLSVDLDAPASNITTVLIQATRWNAVATSYMPSIRRFFDANPTVMDLEIAKSGEQDIALEKPTGLLPMALTGSGPRNCVGKRRERRKEHRRSINHGVEEPVRSAAEIRYTPRRPEHGICNGAVFSLLFDDGVFFRSLQEYSLLIQQWENYGKAIPQYVSSLRGRIADLERENSNLKIHREILERRANTQQERILSLEKDIKHRSAICAAEAPVSPSYTSSTGIDYETEGKYPPPPPTNPLLMLLEAGVQLTKKRSAETDIGGPLKKFG